MHAYYYPNPPLSNFVKCLWFFEEAAPPHTKERLLPDGSTSVVFSLREDRYNVYGKRGAECSTFRGGSIMGPHTDYFVLDTSSQESVIGVQFHPGGAFPFFKLPLVELLNSHISARDLWGPGADDLVGELIPLTTPIKRFQCLERFLLTRLDPTKSIHPAVRLTLGSFAASAQTPISELANSAGLSNRHFIELFRNATGISPKLFQRIARFQGMLRQILNEGINGVEAALTCGYYDQAHCIHEFQEFSGLSPLAYARAIPQSLNHVPLLGPVLE
jgi:AraC-like DNA-binding protein